MKRVLMIVCFCLFGAAACSMLPWAKGGPEETFIVYTSDAIGELKPCG